MDKQEKIRLIMLKVASYGVASRLAEFYSFFKYSYEMEEVQKYEKEKEIVISGLYDLLDDIL